VSDGPRPAGEPRKGGWDKLAILMQPLGGLLTASAVAVVGVMGSQTLERRQSIDTNARLYSELMSRREEAESSLRKDMFVSIIQNFLQPEAATLEAKVLNLELLAYNFHDSLNLKPLFLDMQRRLASASDRERAELRNRVFRVAREVASKQLFALEGHGQTFRRFVDLEQLAAAGKAGIGLEGERIEIDGQACDLSLRVLEADGEQQRLRIRLEVATTADAATDTRATFDVGWFDFPMIDNTRLSNGLRCSVTLGAFSEAGADLVGICFPGEYASLKDRPYYDEVIQKLQDSQAQVGQE
jgi:hypothetical protein